MESVAGDLEFDLARQSVRQLNQLLHHGLSGDGARGISIVNPDGQHSLAAGIDAEIQIDIRGHAGYYVGGMNKRATIDVYGNVGWGVGENMMSGRIHVHGNASACAGASAHGGLLVIDGDAGSRCGISLKGGNICVGGSVGHVSGFMAQAGRMLICGDAGAGLGDSLYEAVIYVRGRIESLGIDARLEPMAQQDLQSVEDLLMQAGFRHPPDQFKRVASARSLYHWNGDHSHYH